MTPANERTPAVRAMYQDTDRIHAKLVAAVATWRAGKRALRIKQYRQRLARPAVEPAHVVAAWADAVERDDAREAETRSPNVTCLKYAAQHAQDGAHDGP